MVDALIVAMCKNTMHMDDAKAVKTIKRWTRLGVKDAYLTDFKFRGRGYCIAVEVKSDEENIRRVVSQMAALPNIRQVIPFTVPAIHQPEINNQT